VNGTKEGERQGMAGSSMVFHSTFKLAKEGITLKVSIGHIATLADLITTDQPVY
jgi:hypothetical protein